MINIFYKYIAINSKGNEVKGILQSKSKKEVIKYLFNRNFIPLKVNIDIRINNKFKNEDLYLLFNKMAMIIKAGIDINTCLEIIIAESNNQLLISTIEIIQYEINQGISLSQSINNTRLFPEIVYHMILTGETSGNLDIVLKHLSEYFKRQNKIENKLKANTVYPKLLFFISSIIFMFIMIILVPQIKNILIDSNLEIPFFTKSLIKLSDIVRNPKVLLILLTILILFLKLFYSQKEYNSLKYKYSLFKRLNKNIEINNNLMYLYIMYSSGIPIFDSIKYLLPITKNKYIYGIINNLISNIEKGLSFSESLDIVLPSLVFIKSSIKVGEETGMLEEILENLANYYTEEVFNSVEYSLKLIEPISIIIIALLIGIIAISILVPILNIMNNII